MDMLAPEPLLILGKRFDLSHLAPSVLACPRLPEQDGSQRPDLLIGVAFSHHCFTETPEKASAEGHRVITNKDPRVFCEQRYDLSRLYLPSMVNSLPQAKVEFAWEGRNYRHLLQGHLEDGSKYAMFFTIKKAETNSKNDLRLFVESAYPILDWHSQGQPKLIRFRLLAMKTLVGEKIRPPPRR